MTLASEDNKPGMIANPLIFLGEECDHESSDLSGGSVNLEQRTLSLRVFILNVLVLAAA